jgi:VanZ family protein
MFRYLKQLILSLTFIAGLLIVIFVELPSNSLFWQEAQNSGHILVFGLLSLVALFTLRSISWFEKHNHTWSYLGAIILSLLTGIMVEFIQLSVGRDAEIIDVLNDGVGVFSFLGLYAFIDPALKTFRSKGGRRLILGISGISLLLPLISLSPFINLTISYYQRDSDFPKLINFSKRWPLAFISTQDATLQIAEVPEQWQLAGQEHLGIITLYSAQYPGFALKEPVSDWSTFSYLTFSIFSDTIQPVKLSLRINDKQHNQKYEDRYNTSLVIEQGKNLFRISLNDIRNGPTDRKLDLHAIDKLVLFAADLDTPLQFYIGNFQLE